MKNITIAPLEQYNELLDNKYGRIGKYYAPKAQKFAKKLLEWKQVQSKQDFAKSYEDSYKALFG